MVTSLKQHKGYDELAASLSDTTSETW